MDIGPIFYKILTKSYYIDIQWGERVIGTH